MIPAWANMLETQHVVIPGGAFMNSVNIRVTIRTHDGPKNRVCPQLYTQYLVPITLTTAAFPHAIPLTPSEHGGMQPLLETAIKKMISLVLPTVYMYIVSYMIGVFKYSTSVQSRKVTRVRELESLRVYVSAQQYGYS